MFQPVFIIGSGRSGTTWLHLMLGSHPQIATGQESQLFHNYFRAMRAKWEEELSYPTTSKLRFHGISSYIDEEKFYGLLRQFADGIFSNLLQAKPEARFLLEKSPNNSFNINTIYRCYPEAKFIHVIRDGRDVVSSMLAAKKSWGSGWAPTYVEPAAQEWQEAVNLSMQAADFTENYIEIRYEDLLDNGYPELERAFKFIGVSVSPEQIQDIYDSHTFDKLKSGDYKKTTFLNPGQTKASGTDSRSEPKDFFNKGKKGTWKEMLTPSQLREFYYVAGALLEELGYEEKGSTQYSKPLSLKIRHLSSKIKDYIKRIAKKVL